MYNRKQLELMGWRFLKGDDRRWYFWLPGHADIVKGLIADGPIKIGGAVDKCNAMMTHLGLEYHEDPLLVKKFHRQARKEGQKALDIILAPEPEPEVEVEVGEVTCDVCGTTATGIQSAVMDLCEVCAVDTAAMPGPGWVIEGVAKLKRMKQAEVRS